MFIADLVFQINTSLSTLPDETRALRRRDLDAVENPAPTSFLSLATSCKH